MGSDAAGTIRPYYVLRYQYTHMASQLASVGSVTTVGVTAHSQDSESTRVATGTGEFVIGTEATPLEYLLGSLAACLNVVGRLVAADHGIVLGGMEVGVEGDIDPARYEGETTDVRAGFREVRVAVSVDADADPATLRAWMAETTDRCPVADHLGGSSTLTVDVERARQ